jgi:hypothetical protein
MVRYRSLLVLVVLVIVFAISSSTAYAQPEGFVDGFLEGGSEGLSGIGDGIGEDLYGAACGFTRSLFEMKLVGEDLILPAGSLYALTHLFKNSCWRNTIWGIDDEREAVVKRMGELKYEECSLGFKSEKSEQEENRLETVKDELEEFEILRQFFGDQRLLLLGNEQFVVDASFGDPDDLGSYVLNETIDLSSLMGWLVGIDALKRYGTHYLEAMGDSFFALGAPLKQLGNTLGQDTISLLFAFKYFGNQIFIQEQYRTFQEYIEARKDILKDEAPGWEKKFLKAMSDLKRDRRARQKQKAEGSVDIGASDSLSDEALDAVLTLLGEQNQTLSDLEDEKLVRLESGSGDAVAIKQSLYYTRAQQQYNTYLQNALGACGGGLGLDAISEKLAETYRAIFGESEGGSFGSAEDLAERIERAKVRSLTKICSGLEEMYRESGRDVTELPVIGKVGEETYCKQAKVCEGDLWECLKEKAKKYFTAGDDVDYKRARENFEGRFQQTNTDALNSLQNVESLRKKQEAFRSFRSQVTARYDIAKGFDKPIFTLINESRDMLVDFEHDGVFEPPPPGNEARIPRTYVSSLRHIYDDFYWFSSQIDGYCPATENPE